MFYSLFNSVVIGNGILELGDDCNHLDMILSNGITSSLDNATLPPTGGTSDGLNYSSLEQDDSLDDTLVYSESSSNSSCYGIPKQTRSNGKKWRSMTEFPGTGGSGRRASGRRERRREWYEEDEEEEEEGGGVRDTDLWIAEYE